MRITQGAFSFLPDLTDDEISKQLDYCLNNGWAVSIEHTDDPHPRNTYWDMWGAPMFDLVDPAGIMTELAECRAANPQRYIRINAFDSTHGVETVASSADRPTSPDSVSTAPRRRGGRSATASSAMRSTVRPKASATDLSARKPTRGGHDG
jgi:ribulose-bisphosphate carboxylase small chain